jgi:methanethiol S-methyltransferase
VYCTFHSVFAANRFKKRAQKLMAGAFIYYRLMYSIFAATTLIAILIFQYSFSSTLLFSVKELQYLGVPLSLAGLVMMIICVKKYFYQLSGVQALSKVEVDVPEVLQVNGLHSRVRHPLYLGTLLFIYGLFLLFPFLNNLIAIAVITAYTLIGIKIEEKKLVEEFGDSYVEYRKRVPMLIPDLKKNKG